MPTNETPLAAQFCTFVMLAVPLMPASPGPSAPPVEQFREFVERATPLIIGPVRETLEGITPRLARLQRWWAFQDLLSVAGFDMDEDPYTELLAWALAPQTHPDSAVARQSAWLRRAPFFGGIDFTRPAIPRTQFGTDDGRPDLVLQYERCVVVLEAKTGTDEHLTRSGTGTPQTLAYPGAVRRALNLDATTPVYVVFLTRDGRKAANPMAFNTSFVEFCLTLTAALEEFQVSRLPGDLRYAYAMLFTHVLTRAAPAGADLGSFIQRFSNGEDRLHDTAFLLEWLNEITVVSNVLSPEVRA
jgi:hypothetical protein